MTGGEGLLVPVLALPACVSLVNPPKPFWSLVSLCRRERKLTSRRVMDGNGVLEWAPHVWSSWSAFSEGRQTEAKLKAEPPVTLLAHSPPPLIPLGLRTCCSLRSESIHRPAHLAFKSVPVLQWKWKTKNEFFSFPFQGTKKIDRTMSRFEHS